MFSNMTSNCTMSRNIKTSFMRVILWPKEKCFHQSINFLPHSYIIREILFPANLITRKSQLKIFWKYFAARSYCLTFYYHMLGSNMGDLKIFTQNGTQSAVEKWSTSGDQGDVWMQVPGIDLKLDPQTKVHPFCLLKQNTLWSSPHTETCEINSLWGAYFFSLDFRFWWRHGEITEMQATLR